MFPGESPGPPVSPGEVPPALPVFRGEAPRAPRFFGGGPLRPCLFSGGRPPDSLSVGERRTSTQKRCSPLPHTPSLFQRLPGVTPPDSLDMPHERGKMSQGSLVSLGGLFSEEKRCVVNSPAFRAHGYAPAFQKKHRQPFTKEFLRARILSPGKCLARVREQE